jgi:PAS domain S-box-containing protein
MLSTNSLEKKELLKNPHNKTKLTLISGLLIFVVYFILSKILTSFSIHLGINSPIWPSAGFAVASYLVFGLRGLLPISIAIILFTIVGQGTLQWSYLPVSLFFALGISIQAVVCDRIINVKKINVNSLADMREIGSFSIICILTSLISAIISQIGIYLTPLDNIIQIDFSFFIWWLGECVGIFIFAPLFFWLSRENKNEFDQKRIKAAVISLVLCLLVICIALVLERKSNNKQLKALYQQQIKNIKSSIDHELERIIITSKMLSSYIGSHHFISNKDFLHYTDIVINSNEAIIGLSWNPLIEDKNRAIFEKKLTDVHKNKTFISVKDQGKVKKSKNNPFYIPVYLISPIEGNEKAVGFDVYSNKVRRDALDKSIRLGVSVATKSIKLVQSQQSTDSILIFHPVQNNSDTISIKANKNEQILGFVTSIINVDLLITSAIKNLNPNLHNIKVIDKANESQLYSSNKDRPLDVLAHNIKNFTIREEISFAENSWILEAQPTKVFLSAFSTGNQWFIFGITITTLFYAMVLFLLGRQRDIESIVKQQTNEINLNRKHLILTLSSIADAVIATDVNGIVIRLNPAAEKLIGMNLNVEQPVHIDSLFALLSGKRASVFLNASTKIRNSLCLIDSKDYVTLNKLDGTTRQVLATASPIVDDNNLFQGIVFILKDRSEVLQLKKNNAQNLADSEDKYKTLILVSNTSAWEYFIDDNYLCCSEEYFSMLGRDIDDYKSKGKNNIAELWSNLIHHEDRYRSIKVFGDYLENPQGMYENTFRMSHKDGSWVWILARGKTLRDANGNPTQRTIGTYINITSQIETQKKLKHSQKMDALGKLTCGVAHDYNNMLAVIQGYADLLTKKLEATSKEFRYVKEIIKASKRGANLTTKLLGFVKTQQDNREVFSLNELVVDQLDMLHKALTTRIEISLNLLNTNPSILTNQNDFIDVLFNLCINSMHAIEHNGSIKLSTGIKKCSNEEAALHDMNAGTYVTFTVEDDGCGMDDLTSSQVFDPFFTTKGEHGTGLGLSQVYGFAKSNQGGIEVTSELGKGTKITIYLPSRKINKNNIPLLNDDDKSDITASDNILIVDDELALLDLAFEFLTSQSYNVKTAQSAENALIILGNEKIDLVVTDIIMPKVDGYQLARIIKENAIDTKIAFVSGYNDESIRENSDMFSQMNLLRKPYTGKELISFVNNSLKKE